MSKIIYYSITMILVILMDYFISNFKQNTVIKYGIL